MKKTVKKELVSQAWELFRVIEERKDLEKRERVLKNIFKVFLDDDTALEVDSFLISLEECSRSSLDKGLLSEYLSEDQLESCKKTTEYKKFNIKKIA